ncbi:MAG: TSUP family transporter [Candidatus Coatesbacteria bacterium]|nr:TSUP family transporter [Candidatus Coatesbacteria bacterium]
MENFWLYIAVGFVAQFINTSLGMAFGVTSNAFLLSLGLPPDVASASVHLAKAGTGIASAASHLYHGNVNKQLVYRLVFTGMAGGVLGAMLLTSFPAETLKPLVGLYLLIMGGRILVKAWRYKEESEREPLPRPLLPLLGAFGGFFDALGGGGWGPIVTTSLLSDGHEPRYVVGSVNTAECFVALAQAVTFLLLIGIDYWEIIVGMLIGGVAAAPLAAWLTKKLKARPLMFIVGGLVVLMSLRTIWLSLESLLA